MNQQSTNVSRRKFLGLSAAGFCAASMCSKQNGAPQKSGATGMDSKDQPYALIRTSEFFGDALMQLSFPPGWRVKVCKMNGHDTPSLTDEQIRQALQNTIGTDRIAALAQGKQNVVITFDDCARPTPGGRLVPFVIEELRAAGVKDDCIFFHAANGSHSVMTQQEMTAKLGAGVVAQYPCWNHDCFFGLTSLGVTDEGMPIKLSKRFLDTDFKICLSGVKPHGMAGYGGGAKSIVPGVASIDTISYVHDVLDNRFPSGLAFVNNEVRLQMEEAARRAKVDMSINIVMNGDREVTGVFAGDVVAAHRAAARLAHPIYHTEIAKDMDVVISNAYPQSVEASKEIKYCSMSLREGGSAVLIQDTPAGQRKMHYSGWRKDEVRLGLKKRGKTGLPVPQASQVIIFNRWPAKWDELNYSDQVYFASTWDEVVARLKRIHGEGTLVAVYPCAGLQHQPLELRI